MARSLTSRKRAVLFRALAVLLSLSPLAALEIGLRVAGYEGASTRDLDPFIDFADVRPLFEQHDERFEIPKSRQEYFRPEEFLAEKPSNEYRIFCIGGSTVQGRPYAIETAFSTWLEVSLRTADPNCRWNAVNCGGVSYASYRLTPILTEVLQYEPDLIVLYSGHNEFLEERTYRDWRRQPEWARRMAKSLEWSRSFRLIRAFSSTPQRDVMTAEVDAMLDYRDGLRQYHRDDRWHDVIADHYERNMQRMIQMAHDADVPMIVCNPVAHLATPPFKSQHDDLSASEQAKFDQLWKEATKGEMETRQRRDVLEQVVRISPRFANGRFALANCLEELGELEAAYREYIRAKDEDVCPIRMTEPLHQRLKQVVQAAMRDQPQLVWLDVRSRFEGLSEGGIAGDKWLVDHVHPSIHGHQKIAEWLLEAMIDHQIVDIQIPEDFEQRSKIAQREHVSGLPTLYFEQAKRRLEGLERWAQGRALKVRPKKKSSYGLP